MATGPRDVFVNCPFDAEYSPLFRALVFAIEYCGFSTRCGLEVDDAGETRSLERRAGGLRLRGALALAILLFLELNVLSRPEVAARIPGGQMADLVRHAVGVDLVEVALRQALGEPELEAAE